MESHSVLAIAELAATTLGRSMIFVQAHSEGAATRLSDAFPSFGEEALTTLTDDGFVVLTFDGSGETRAQFDYIRHNLERESTLVEARVTMIDALGQKRTFACINRQVETVEG